MGRVSTLNGRQIAEHGLDGWAFLVGGLQTRIETGSFAAGLALVDAIGAEAERAQHHPDVDLRYPHVDVRLTSHDVGGVSDRDVAMARAIADLAQSAGHRLDATAVSLVEMGLDTPDRTVVMPFWAAVLAYEAPGGDADDEVRDPAGAGPTVWFQPSGSEEPRQRWHPDVWVDPSQVEPRIEAALAAGGSLVSDAEAPSFWVLADPEGNRVCLCTWQDRES
ncbi:4a-hydroxytetrahydrobiopterin dehydratase [Mumia flava]|uniref:Putative pterin-4-alpha-carbinolamine dehydratase n=1 Tax=Mumia flava TaxID=1348852 RepID=A0A2M9BIP5_9ACTN|nr:4a-hydroxytetrahydrobiopterin dehydratase [Mumia flava]